MTRAEYAERLEQGERLGWVYFLETGPTSPIKIGWAKDPIKRANQLQTGHPDELILIWKAAYTASLVSAGSTANGSNAAGRCALYDRS